MKLELKFTENEKENIFYNGVINLQYYAEFPNYLALCFENDGDISTKVISLKDLKELKIHDSNYKDAIKRNVEKELSQYEKHNI